MSVLFIAFRFSYYFNCSSHLDDQRHPPIRRKSSECVYNLRARKWSLLSTSVSEVFQFELKTVGFIFVFLFGSYNNWCFLTFWPACLWHSQHQVECTLSGMCVANHLQAAGCSLQSTLYHQTHSTLRQFLTLLVKVRFLSVHARLPFFCIYVRARGDGQTHVLYMVCYLHGLPFFCTPPKHNYNNIKTT